MAYNPTNPNGQATSANSSPVVLASDQSNVATKGGFLEINNSISAVNGDIVPSTDVSAYKWISIQISGTFAATISWQASNDNTNFVSVSSLSPLSTIGPGVTTTGTGIFSFPVQYRYFRARVTAYTSGTVVGNTEIYTYASSFPFNYGSMAQNGTWNVGLSAGTNTVGSVVVAPLATATGLTSFQNTAVAATAVTVKASAGRLHRITIQNPNNSIAWLQIFNTTTPTIGTTAPVMSIPIPASSIFEDFYPMSDTFSTAIAIAATTTPTGSTANTTALFVSLGYI